MDIQQQKSYKILLVGDSCIDWYHFGECDRLSPEAPIPVLKQTYTKKIGGMSLNVKNNLEAYGVFVKHITNQNLIEKHRLFDIKSNYQIARFDVGEQELLSEADIKKISPKNYDCLVISDYCKGTITENIAKNLCNMFSGVPIFIDTKKQDLSCFSNAFIKINERERKMIKKKGKKIEFITTLGSHGASYKGKIYQTDEVEAFDVCGAGDVFLSSLVYWYLKSNSIEHSIECANKFAARSVTKIGTYVVTKKDIDSFLSGDDIKRGKDEFCF